MRQTDTKAKELIEAIREGKPNGETNREIAADMRLTLKQVKQRINRENRRERLWAQGMLRQVLSFCAGSTGNGPSGRARPIGDIKWQALPRGARSCGRSERRRRCHPHS